MEMFKVTLANGQEYSIESNRGKDALDLILRGTDATFEKYEGEPIFNFHLDAENTQSLLLLEVRALRAFIEEQNNPKRKVKIRINMSAGQDTPFGKILAALYYGSGWELLERAPGRSGYPHNGGSHTLYLNGAVESILKFFDELQATYPDAKSALDNLREQIKDGTKPIRLPHGF